MNASKVIRLAKVAAPLFVQDERPDGDKFIRTADDAPEWVHDLAMHAHGDMMPDDWRYRFISDALDVLAGMDEDASEDDIDDRRGEIEPSIYNYELLDWLGSHAGCPVYVDEAVENADHSDRGIMGDIQMGQVEEEQEVFGLVCEFLDAMEEAEPEDGTD